VLHLLDETPVAGGEVLGAEVSAPASLRLLAMRPPLPWPLSNRWTVCPAFCKAWAADKPAMPVPMMAIGTVMMASSNLAVQTTLSGKPVQYAMFV
jgi:hypothetical protein